MPNSQADTATGAPNPPSITANDGQTATDNVTGLIWQRDVTLSATTYTWDDAVAYCSALDLGGYNDWRLPTRIEIQSIFDYGKNPALDGTIFKNMPTSGSFWTSSPSAGNILRAWSIFASQGQVETNPRSQHFNVLCVR